MFELIMTNDKMVQVVRTILILAEPIDVNLLDLGSNFTAVSMQLTETQLDTVLNICEGVFEENLDYFIQDVIII